MKKNLFRKFLALFLTGTMLAGVGCKDYDDDIDKLNNRVDGLETDVVTLKTDVTSLKATQDAFNKIDFTSFVTNTALQTKLDDVLKDYAKKSDLKAWLTSEEVLQLLKDKGYMTKTEIETLIGNSVLDEDDVKGIFNNMLTGEAIMGKIQTDVQEMISDALDAAGYMTGDSALSTSQVNQIMTALATAMSDETSATCQAFKTWLGPEMAEYLSTYITTDEFKAAAGAAANASVLEQLNTANSELQKKINDMIGAALSGDEENPFLQKSDLAAVQQKYDAAIAVLWGAIGDIAGRIQSLVYVPENALGYAFFRGAAIGDYALTEGKKATMTFRVSPASLAQKIAEGYNAEKKSVELAILPEKVEILTRAAEEIYFVIEGEVIAENGKISMIVNTNYPYDKLNENETYSVALQVISKSNATMPGEPEGEEGEKIETGIEYTSDYVPTIADPEATDILDKIVLAKEVEGEFVEYVAKAEYNLVYNDITTQATLLGDYSFVYKVSDDELITLADAAKKYSWDVVPAAKPVIERTGFTTDAVEEDLAIAPEDPMAEEAVAELVTIGLKKANVANIDKKVTDQGKLFVAVEVETDGKVETETVENGTYEAVLNITRKSLGTIDNIDATINWFYYGDINGTKVGYAFQNYLSQPIFVDGENKVLSKEQYEGIKASLAGATWVIDEEASDAEFLAANDNLAVTAEAISDPYVGTDSKVLQYTIKNYGNGNGTVYVSTKVLVNDNEEVTLKGAITFNGLPDMNYEVNVANGEMDINGGQNNIWVSVEKDFYATMFAKLPAEQAYFKDLAEFKEFMGKSKLVAEDQKADAAKKIAQAGLRQNGTILRAFFKMNTVDFNAANAYTYTVPEESYYVVSEASPIFKINLSGSVTINKENGYYLGIGANLYTDKTPYYMKANGKIEGNAFKTESVQLTSGYGKVMPDGSTANAVVTYTLKTTTPDGYTGTLPTIDGGTSGTTGVLDWNGCQLDAVEVEAVMVVDGLTIDTKTFNVELVKPIDFAKWVAFAKGTLAVETNKEATINLHKVMNTKVSNKNVALDIFGNNLLTDTGLATNVADDTYYGLAVEFANPKYKGANGATTFENFSFNNATGVLTYSANNAPLAGMVTATVEVTFTYKYALDSEFAPVKFTKTVTVEINNK